MNKRILNHLGFRPSFAWGRLATILLLIGLGTGCNKSSGPEPEKPVIPDIPGYPFMAQPADNPATAKGVKLGRKLFYDPILSGDSTQSCAVCHNQKFAFSDRGKRFSHGITGDSGTLNAPAIINAGWIPRLFWDGRAASLEDQALGPVANPIEMNLPWPEAVARIKAHPVYPQMFQEAFGDIEIDSMLVVKAIAQFERTLISNNSKFDRIVRGEAKYTDSELRGVRIFLDEKGDCFHCHINPLFENGGFQNNGLDSQIVGVGRSAVTGDSRDFGKWKTPTLRNIALTAPYMHDGRFKTLEEVLDHYNGGIIKTPTVHPKLYSRPDRPPDQLLTEQDKADIIAFLHTLTDSSFITNPDFGPPDY
jgi:cytochrome c peroxidase